MRSAVTAIAIAFFAILMVPVSAQTGVLTGSVFDSDTQEAVSYASISVDSAQFGTVSDEEGQFAISSLPEGVHHVVVSRIGYTSRTYYAIEISPDDTARLSVKLDQQAVIADEVVVTASRKSQSIKLAPASTSIVTAKDIQQKQIQTFDQALDDVPGLVISRSSGSNVQSVSIRGASETAGGGVGNRVLLLIDGRPALSPESGGALWNLVPVNSLERIEVIKGAYSALFGSSAMGGVINAITRKPTETPETRVHLNYGAYGKQPPGLGYNVYRDFSSIQVGHSRKVGRLSYLFDAGRTANSGHREKSGFTLYNGYGKLQYEFAPNRQLTVSGNFNKIKSDAPSTWLSQDRPYLVAEYKKDDFQNKTEGAVDVHYSAITNSRAKYQSRFYYYQNLQLFSFNDDPENDSTNINKGKQFVDASSIRTHRVGNVSQVDWTFGKNNYALAGIDFKYDKIVALPDTILYGRHNAIEFGAYIQDEWTPVDQLTITAGVRFDYYNIIDEFSEVNISPKVAAVYRPSEIFSVRALWARAFRNAAIAERFIKFEQGGGLRFRPNPDLVSEKLTSSFEVGTIIKPIAELSIDLGLFHNRYKDLISFIQVSQPLEPLTYQVVNLQQAVMQGFEIGLNYRPCTWFSFRTAYAYLDAKDTSPDRFNDVLAYKPKHTYSFTAAFSYKGFGLFVNGRGRSEIEEVFIYPDSNPVGYFLIGSKLTYNFKEGKQLYFSMNNIGNVQYEELERYRMPGRSYSGGVVLNF